MFHSDFSMTRADDCFPAVRRADIKFVAEEEVPILARRWMSAYNAFGQNTYWCPTQRIANDLVDSQFSVCFGP
jgi:hypothetical protein